MTQTQVIPNYDEDVEGTLTSTFFFPNLEQQAYTFVPTLQHIAQTLVPNLT